jgi:hypothetical protein
MKGKKKPRPVVHQATAPYQEKIPDRWTDEELAKQGTIDRDDAWLWVGRTDYLKTLIKQLGWWARNELNDKGRVGMYHIIEKNTGLREQRERDEEARATTAPAPPPAVTEVRINGTVGGLADVVKDILTLQAEQIAVLRAENTRLKETPTAG